MICNRYPKLWPTVNKKRNTTRWNITHLHGWFDLFSIICLNIMVLFGMICILMCWMSNNLNKKYIGLLLPLFVIIGTLLYVILALVMRYEFLRGYTKVIIRSKISSRRKKIDTKRVPNKNKLRYINWLLLILKLSCMWPA